MNCKHIFNHFESTDKDTLIELMKLSLHWVEDQSHEYLKDFMELLPQSILNQYTNEYRLYRGMITRKRYNNYYSEYTSWTVDKSVANDFRNKESNFSDLVIDIEEENAVNDIIVDTLYTKYALGFSITDFNNEIALYMQYIKQANTDLYNYISSEFYETMAFETIEDYTDHMQIYSHEKEVISSFDPDNVIILEELETIIDKEYLN